MIDELIEVLTDADVAENECIQERNHSEREISLVAIELVVDVVPIRQKHTDAVDISQSHLSK